MSKVVPCDKFAYNLVQQCFNYADSMSWAQAKTAAKLAVQLALDFAADPEYLVNVDLEIDKL